MARAFFMSSMMNQKLLLDTQLWSSCASYRLLHWNGTPCHFVLLSELVVSLGYSASEAKRASRLIATKHRILLSYGEWKRFGETYQVDIPTRALLYDLLLFPTRTVKPPTVLSKSDRNKSRKRIIRLAHEFGRRYGLQSQHTLVRAYQKEYKKYKKEQRLEDFPHDTWKEKALAASRTCVSEWSPYNQALLLKHRTALQTLLCERIQQHKPQPQPQPQEDDTTQTGSRS
jgi:hypothetical protein